ncbi:MAG: hypothetical protein WCJ40_00635 [Planctomycetota bacterium]
MILWNRQIVRGKALFCLVLLIGNLTGRASIAQDQASGKPEAIQNQEKKLRVGASESDKAQKPLSKAEKQKIRETWIRRYQNAVKKLKTANAAEVDKIEAMILQTNDPSALGPMLEVMGKESAPIRLLLDRALANLDDDLAWVALAERLLIEPEPEVRRGLIKQIETRQDKAGYDRFIRHIKLAVTSKNPVRAGLGAMSSADLGLRDWIPDLIDQLAPIRLSRRVEWVPERVSAGNGGGGGLSVGSVDGYVSVPVPVVGPGVVAYGQNIIPVGNSLSMGGGGAPNSVQLTPVLRSGREAFPNPAVLASLVQLTGEDFGYDVQIWKKWQAESFRLNGAPQKRVPKP